MRRSQLQDAALYPASQLCPAPLSAVSGAHFLKLTGCAAIVAAEPMLQELAARCCQPGAANYIEHFLTQPYMGGKIPHLLLCCEAPVRTVDDLRPSLLLGTVLVHEYQAARIPLGIFVTEDLAGERNVLAPAPIRSAVALRTAGHLLERGATVVAISLQDALFDEESTSAARLPRGVRWSQAERTLRRRLPLSTSYDLTLQTLGRHTRRNLRYYRRRAEEQVGCQFLPDAQVDEDFFVALNRLCSYPTPDFVARWRHRSATTLPGGVMAGIRSEAGEWISMAGGRSYSGILSIDWQMNQTRFGSLSLSSVLRSYLMEHAIGAGIHTLMFEGGTPHSMQMSFAPDRVVDLLVSSEDLPARILRRYGGSLLPRRNFLARVLSHPDLQWQRC